MPKVSVIIPCYNQGQYVDEAVDSVLAQTFQDFEIVIVNDGSTDEYTNNKLKNYNKPKTKVINTKNYGLSAARNNAVKNSSGKYILPLDADDKIEKTYLEKAVKILDNNPDTKIVYCDIQHFGESNKQVIFPEFNLNLFLINNIIHASGMFRKKDFNLINGYDESMTDGLEDWEFWMAILENGGDVYKIPEKLLLYRRYDNSMISKLIKDPEKYNTVNRYIINKHIHFYSDILGNPMELTIKLNDLTKKIKLIENSRSYKLGHIITAPYNLFKNIWKKPKN